MTQEMLNFCGEKNITADVEVGWAMVLFEWGCWGTAGWFGADQHWVVGSTSCMPWEAHDV
jgi:hypothetical protein